MSNPISELVECLPTYLSIKSILTVVLFLAAFLLEDRPTYLFLFNLIFSYLWLAVVVFAAFLFSDSTRQAQTVEAFSFLALSKN